MGSMNDGPFDRRVVRLHRAAAAGNRQADFLFADVADRLADRLDDITRRFPVALELGARDGAVSRALAGKGKTDFLVEAGLAPAFAHHLAVDEEHLPFAPSSLDAVISNLALHWVNDLVGTLIQVRMALKPDGLFLAALLGGETLVELRHALADSEIAITGGLSPRLSPMIDVRDAGALLQRAGYALPVVDTDRITVTYPDAFALMRDLRAMGESNALIDRPRTFARRDVFLHAASLYQDRHADHEKRIPATFNIIYLTAWAPHASQQQPLTPGSGNISLTQVLQDP